MLKLTNSLLSTFGFNLKKFFYSITSLHLFFFNLLKYIKTLLRYEVSDEISYVFKNWKK